MLKDKSCYQSPRIYAAHYYLHKANTQDYCIDPLLGSFIRVAYPPKDLPEDAADMYKKPQFMFMTRNNRSRLYDLKEARSLVDGIYNLIKEEEKEHPVRFAMTINNKLTVDEFANISYKGPDGDLIRLITGPQNPRHDRGPNNAMMTKERYLNVLENLHYALKCALMGEGEERPYIQMGPEWMFTVRRGDERISEPFVVTARKFPNRDTVNIVVQSNGERMMFPLDKAGIFDMYMEDIIELSEGLMKEDVTPGNGKVRFVRGNDTVADGMMEYVNCRKIKHSSGTDVQVMMNSDRYFSNTKLQFIYDRAFVETLKERFSILLADVKAYCNAEKDPFDNTGTL